MEIRPLSHDDMDRLSDFIIDAYESFPQAMWFGSKPSRESLERIFYNKMRGIAERMVSDFVALQGGLVLGECEIVKTGWDSGIVGMVVRKEFLRTRIGTKLLDAASSYAEEIGMRKLRVEVSSDNEGAIKFFIVNGFAPIRKMKMDKEGIERTVVVLEKKVR